MTEEELSKFLTDNSARIKEAAVEACIEKVRDNIRFGLPSSVQDVVSAFMKDEVAPAVAKALAGEKGAIIAAAVSGAAKIGDELSKTMVENAVKNMTGYRGSEIIKDLMKS
ncbi:hypothetical protein N6L27_03605 [Leisingera sp. SS27]|uniref:hypothetical protein n=1 Tax=Leisingera sp. SS27 TaxID=2979462 RepID=UPI00232D2F46|nr:hypothetical protein [Leisingera sp. SS27]MDC0657076.1 hypothetical protein [Leisingera sp. SS27]